MYIIMQILCYYSYHVIILAVYMLLLGYYYSTLRSSQTLYTICTLQPTLLFVVFALTDRTFR